MIKDHALVKLIPLIGVPVDAGLQECESCHRLFHLWEVTLKENKFICDICVTKDEKV